MTASAAHDRHDVERRGRSEVGMTLIEVLIVLAIVAITASVSVLAIGTGSGTNGQAEAARLASRLQLAADRAMVEDSGLALMPAKDGYAFAQWDGTRGAWQPSRFADLGERRVLPAGMSLAADDPRAALPLGADAGGRGFTLTLAADDRRWRIAFDGMTARLLTTGQPAR